MKKVIFLLIFVFSISFGSNVICQAHEMYTDYSTGTLKKVVLRWNIKNATTGRLKVITDDYYLSGSWAGTNYTTAISAWHSSSAPVECFDSAINQNTYFCTTTVSYWQNKYPDTFWGEVMGATELYDTNDISINSYSEAYNSTKLIKGANIYVKPNPTNNTTYDYVSTMTHELGHVLCLGHSHLYYYEPANIQTDPSIMSYDYLDSTGATYTPKNHEVDNVKSMYGY